TGSDSQDPTQVEGVKCFTPVLESGLTFNGASSGTRATVLNNTSYNFGTGDFTLEAWINVGTQTAADPAIVSYRTTTSNGFMFSMTSSGADLLLQIAGTNTFSHGFTDIRSTGCHHVAVARLSGALQFYLDGSALGGTLSNTGSVSSTGSIFFGYDTPDNISLSGNVNEVRIWNVNRTAAQISSNLQTIFPSGTSNLVGYWKLNESADETIYDQSSTA